MKIAVIGAGYVGLTTSIIFAAKGHDVICVEKDQYRLDLLRKGRIPFFEPQLDNLFHDVLIKEKISITSKLTESIQNSEIIFIAVGTPGLENGSIDLSQLEKVSEEIGKALSNSNNQHCIVVKSTVIPGTTVRVVKKKVLNYAAKNLVSFAMNPEFLRQGKAVDDALNPDRIMLGCDDEKTAVLLKKVYALFDAPILVTSVENAEMIKYTSNAFLATLISFSNEIANICETISNCDVTEILEAVYADRRLNVIVNGVPVKPGILAYLKAGCGFGGSCLPKDVAALQYFAIKDNKINTPLLNAVLSINKERPLKMIEKLRSQFPDVTGLAIGIIGLTFKADTSDLRSSPGLEIAETLCKLGAKVTVWDPYLKMNHEKISFSFHVIENFEEFLSSIKVIIITTECMSKLEIEMLYHYVSYDNNIIILDGRGCLDKKRIKNNIYYSPGIMEGNLA